MIDEGYSNIIEDIISLHNDDYYKLVFNYPLDFYRKRVDMVGFKGYDHVLDIGCGYGQWSVVLSEVNTAVTSVDHSENMLNTTKIMKRHYNRKNIVVQHGKLPELDFPNESFDAIWCWSVLMFVDRDAVLKEFYRVLKPGGKILIGAKNARGRWLFKMIKALKERNTKRFYKALEVFFKGNGARSRPNYTNLVDVCSFYEAYNFKVIAKDYDGHIDLSGNAQIEEIFEPKYFFFDNNIEFILEKK